MFDGEKKMCLTFWQYFVGLAPAGSGPSFGVYATSTHGSRCANGCRPPAALMLLANNI